MYGPVHVTALIPLTPPLCSILPSLVYLDAQIDDEGVSEFEVNRCHYHRERIMHMWWRSRRSNRRAEENALRLLAEEEKPLPLAKGGMFDVDSGDKEEEAAYCSFFGFWLGAVAGGGGGQVGLLYDSPPPHRRLCLYPSSAAIYVESEARVWFWVVLSLKIVAIAITDDEDYACDKQSATTTDFVDLLTLLPSIPPKESTVNSNTAAAADLKWTRRHRRTIILSNLSWWMKEKSALNNGATVICALNLSIVDAILKRWSKQKSSS
ncbi:hypothetical protein CPC08DRAFT_727207 [Agrocybe pediades]|nr:hypothetical protein CPC08DRAFT_727207 [Agrocybe pediades]